MTHGVTIFTPWINYDLKKYELKAKKKKILQNVLNKFVSVSYFKLPIKDPWGDRPFLPTSMIRASKSTS